MKSVSFYYSFLGEYSKFISFYLGINYLIV